MRKLLKALGIATIILFYLPIYHVFSGFLYEVNKMMLFIYWVLLTVTSILIGFMLLEMELKRVRK
ncbi:hypothetical protein QPL79_07680 [Ignisphaera sp. 4213-co]|uniref:DUF3311 domain-containing protein n=1 Tax=Ignisphaera cupida TaxID=3050454 RepID=A0ABD4Z7B7_9CREN|nr:hypothetical protein [Ignisphaera sp. 4213-co]MDK6029242.1 hypothetical protein [Ignisphaera sp. 4213-co]